MTCDTSGVKRARTTHKAQPPLVPEKPVEGQNEKPAPLETPPWFGVADPLSPPEAGGDAPPQQREPGGGASPRSEAHRPQKGGEPPPHHSERAAQLGESPVGEVGERPSTSHTARVRQKAKGISPSEASGVPATVPESVGKPAKEKRGKRYTSLQSVRKGLARVENDLAAGKLDAKTAAVRVQALQAIANVLALAEGAKLNREAAEMTARASALVKTGGARA